MTVLHENLEALKPKLSASAFRQLSMEVPDANCEIISSRTALPTLRYRGLFIHSRHDPEREAQRLVSAGVKTSSGGAVFFGFGLGYAVEAFLAATAELPALVVVPDIPLFLTALSARDLRHLLLSERVTLLFDSDPGTVIDGLETLRVEDPSSIRIRALSDLYGEVFLPIEKALSEYQARKDVNRNTLARFGKLWVKNLVRNMRLIAATPGIAQLEKLFTGLPALLVAAGPSLDTVLPHLREIRERCVVIAVDTSLRACLASGVDPDFTVIVDPQYWNTRHLDWAGSSRSLLISESSTHPRVFRGIGGGTFFCSSVFPLGEYLERSFGRKGKLGAGGSVSTSAWDFARILGCGPVFCAGLDLGFPQLQTHFKGGFFEERVHTHSQRLKPGETDSFHALRDAQPFPLLSNTGGTVLSDKRLIIYKWWFETQMRLHPDSDTRNLSPHGVAIEGISYTPMESLLNLPERRTEIDAVLTSLRTAAQLSGEDSNRALETALSELIPQLKKLSHLATAGMEESRRLGQALRSGTDLSEYLRALDRIDRGISRTEAREIAGFLLHSIRREINFSEAGQSGEEIVRNSFTLYSRLHEAVEYHLSLLESSRIPS